MKLKELTLEQLETMSYDDLAYIVLEENGKKMKLLDIFKKISKVLKLTDEEMEARIADFFEVLSTNKQFVMLDKGYWDLSIKHMKNVVIEDEEELESEEVSEEIIMDEDEEDKEIYYNKDDEDADDDDLSDLVIIDPEEETSLE